MRISNKIPSIHVISETKINEQVFTGLLEKTNLKEYVTEWNKNNAGKKISDSEKLVEFLDLILLNNHHKTNESALYEIFMTKKMLLEATSTCVFFENIPYNVVQDLKKYNISHTKPDIQNISFWVPPQIAENKETLLEYGLNFRDLGKHIESILDIKNDERPIVSLLPQNVQVNAFLNINLNTWKNIIVDNTQPHICAENRFIFILLLKDFKRRYNSLFSDIKVISSSDNTIYGINSITDENWYNFYTTT